MAQLPPNLSERIDLLSEQGNILFDDAEFWAAIGKWKEALSLLPAPTDQWEAAMWLHASIGDAHYQLGLLDQCRDSLLEALKMPGALENPFVWYRLGQAERQLGDHKASIDHLLRAYMLDGSDIFNADDDGKRYLSLLRDARLI